MSRWYRAYEGLVTDQKIAEVSLFANCSRSVAIAVWHCLLESAAGAQDHGRFDVTPRRVAAALIEPIAVIEAVFKELETVGMIKGDIIVAWTRRQFESDKSSDRVRRHREAKRNGDETLHHRYTPVSDRYETVMKQDETAPDTETESETENIDRSVDKRPREKSGEVASPPDRSMGSGAEDFIRVLHAAGLLDRRASSPGKLKSDAAIVANWIEAGWSLELDIIPAVTEAAAKMVAQNDPPSHLNAFKNWIGNHHARRMGQKVAATAQAAKPSAIPKDPNVASRESAERKMAKHYGSPKTEIALRKAMMALWCGKDQFGAVKPYAVGAVFPKGWIKHHFSNQQNVIALADECYRSENLSGILNAAGMDERAYYALVDSEAAKFYAAGLTGKEYFDIPENDEPHLPGGDEWPDIPPTLAHDAISHEVDMDAA